MIRFVHLRADEQAKIDAKLAELKEKTGRLWTCEVTRPPESTDPTRFLEIAIEGQILKPVVLDGDDNHRAEQICAELNRAYQDRRLSSATAD